MGLLTRIALKTDGELRGLSDTPSPTCGTPGEMPAAPSSLRTPP
jgi:hypothetical protein